MHDFIKGIFGLIAIWGSILFLYGILTDYRYDLLLLVFVVLIIIGYAYRKEVTKYFSDLWLERKHGFLEIATFFIVSLLVVVVIWIAGDLISKDEQRSGTCECFEIIGDEENFICYTPEGEIDTKGECVGSKIYK